MVSSARAALEPRALSEAPHLLHADLSMGAWVPGQAAAELARQLGIDPPRSGDGPSGDIISLGVDREARGDGTLLAAYDDAMAIARAIPRGTEVVVTRPRFGLPSRSDNRALVRFLRGLGVRVRIRGAAESDEVDLPPLLRIYPGAVSQQVAAAMRLDPLAWALRPLPGGSLAIPSGGRTVDPRRHPQLVDELAAYEELDPRLAAFCQCLGSPLFIRSGELARAAVAAAPRCADLGLDLGLRARRSARTPLEAGTAELHLQGIRIFLHCFHEVASSADPSPKLPEELRAELLTMKGWGRVMAGDAEEARRCFSDRLDSAAGQSQPSVEDLYFLNIAALACLRGGDLAGALALERRIESCLADGPNADPQIVFVNAINLARLSRMTGDDEGHRNHLVRAIATSEGSRSLNEAVQLNRLLGSAGTGEGGSRAAVLRAALAWLALEPRQAVGVRTLRAVLGTDHVPGRRREAAVSSALLADLRAKWGEAAEPAGEDLRGFASADEATDLRPARALHADGVALLWSPDRRPSLAWPGDTERLAESVLAVLRNLFPELGAVGGGTLLLDPVTGGDLGGSPAQARASAWRFGLAAGDPEVRLGAAVRQIEDLADGSIRIRFRRHLDPARAEGDSASIIRTLACGPRRLSGLGAGAGADVRDLAARRIVSIELPDA
jgi:hypothetical protein